jgi:hypothetical protein
MTNSNTFDINKLNNLIQQASQTIGCDTNCQQQRNAEQLKTKYLDAKVNELTAENQLQIATKNYMTFTEGTSAYNSYMDNDLTAKATKITDLFQTNFNNEVNKVNDNINTYKGLLINYNNVNELHSNYITENKQLEKNFKNKNIDIITNDRKTYYEEQGITNLQFYYYLLLIIYVICVVVFVISLFVYSSSLTINWKIKIIIVIFLVILPFISSSLLSLIIDLFYKIYSILPKNVHLSL